MNIKKIVAGLAAVSVLSATAVSASAVLTTSDSPDPGLNSSTNMWLVQLYNVGSETENKPATDYGINYADVAKIVVDVKAIEPEYFDGGLGGAVIWSNNGGDIVSGPLWDKYNWPGNWNFWGVVDDDLEISTQDGGAGVLATKIGDYTYELVADVYDSNPLHNGDAASIGCMQTGIQYWGNDMSDYEVISLKALDSAGNELISFDSNGTPSKPSVGATVTTTETAPAAGDVQAATTSSKGSPDTGVEDVAAVAGLAVVAAGAVLVAKKRK